MENFWDSSPRTLFSDNFRSIGLMQKTIGYVMHMMMEAEEVGWDCFENRDISCNTEITERDFSLRQMVRNVKQTGGKKAIACGK